MDGLVHELGDIGVKSQGSTHIDIIVSLYGGIKMLHGCTINRRLLDQHMPVSEYGWTLPGFPARVRYDAGRAAGSRNGPIGRWANGRFADDASGATTARPGLQGAARRSAGREPSACCRSTGCVDGVSP